MDIFQLLDALHEAARSLGNRPVPVKINGLSPHEVKVCHETGAIIIKVYKPQIFGGL